MWPEPSQPGVGHLKRKQSLFNCTALPHQQIIATEYLPLFFLFGCLNIVHVSKGFLKYFHNCFKRRAGDRAVAAD